MKVIKFILGILSGALMFFGDIIPFMNGFVFAFADGFASFLDGLDGCYVEEYYHGFHILLLSILIVIMSSFIILLSIISYILTWKPLYRTCTVMYVITDVLTFLAIFIEAYLAYWMNTRKFLSESYEFLYFWPVVQGIILVLLVVFTFINAKRMKDDDSYNRIMANIQKKKKARGETEEEKEMDINIG